MRRLKIVEQIIIVLIFALLIPFCVIGVIISNISQHSIRSELANSASLIAQFLGNNIENYAKYSKSELNQIATGLNFISDTMDKMKYFDEIEAKNKLFKGLDIVEDFEVPKNEYKVEDNRITLYAPIDNAKKFYVKAQIDIDILDILIGAENTKTRNIYIFDNNNNLILTNAPKNTVQDALTGLVVSDNIKQTIFSKKKNTPKAYYKINHPDWFIIVDTTKKVTTNTITEARYKIILSLIVAILSIIVIVGLYISYLYINIRQLFKGIKAISKGNYDKKIHLIKRIFTPHEIVFLAKEFNYMANKINVSHHDLKEKNKELKKLNEFREDLINSTSHEFRTPLTNIIGYTSRLLRKDIKLDEETKIKSLQIIKQQAQRLSRMVEDLLVIPQMDTMSLKYDIQETDLTDSLNHAIDFLKTPTIEFIVNISSDLKYVYVDNSRLEQILLNLIENAIKYSKDNMPIEIKAFNDIDKGIPTVIIKNSCEKIEEEIKKQLFEKFVRADSKLTRTTRGTGLGLYIVRGLCNAMKIDIEVSIDDYFIIKLKFNDYVT